MEDPAEITPLEKPIRLASQAATQGEKHARYSEQHLCCGCAHLAVCEVGRHTADLFAQDWLVSVADCSNYIALEDEDEES
jgi:hypothetical protein